MMLDCLGDGVPVFDTRPSKRASMAQDLGRSKHRLVAQTHLASRKMPRPLLAFT